MDALEYVTLRDVVYVLVGVSTLISVLIEKSKNLPFHPWSRLFKWLGNNLTEDLHERLEQIEQQQAINNEAITELNKKVDNKFREKQEDDDTKEAKRLRARIIEFSDSCRIGNHHTKTHFENVMRDYSDYAQLCEIHNIPNHYIDSEYHYIEGIYQKCLRENSFL